MSDGVSDFLIESLAIVIRPTFVYLMTQIDRNITRSTAMPIAQPTMIQ